MENKSFVVRWTSFVNQSLSLETDEEKRHYLWFQSSKSYFKDLMHVLSLHQGRGFAFILVSLFTYNKIAAHCLCLVGYNPPTLLDFHGLCPWTTSTLTPFLFQGCQVLPTLAFGVLVSPFSSTLGGCFFSPTTCMTFPAVKVSSNITFSKNLWDHVIHSDEFSILLLIMIISFVIVFKDLIWVSVYYMSPH